DVGNELLAAYGKVGEMGLARKVFDEICVRSCVSWNTMVSGFAYRDESKAFAQDNA
ncbi:putative pentatricopeptide repeat-containing protein, partial [Tanacetum coccineum]